MFAMSHPWVLPMACVVLAGTLATMVVIQFPLTIDDWDGTYLSHHPEAVALCTVAENTWPRRAWNLYSPRCHFSYDSDRSVIPPQVIPNPDLSGRETSRTDVGRMEGCRSFTSLRLLFDLPQLEVSPVIDDAVYRSIYGVSMVLLDR